MDKENIQEQYHLPLTRHIELSSSERDRTKVCKRRGTSIGSTSHREWRAKRGRTSFEKGGEKERWSVSSGREENDFNVDQAHQRKRHTRRQVCSISQNLSTDKNQQQMGISHFIVSTPRFPGSQLTSISNNESQEDSLASQYGNNNNNEIEEGEIVENDRRYSVMNINSLRSNQQLQVAGTSDTSRLYKTAREQPTEFPRVDKSSTYDEDVAILESRNGLSSEDGRHAYQHHNTSLLFYSHPSKQRLVKQPSGQKLSSTPSPQLPWQENDSSIIVNGPHKTRHQCRHCARTRLDALDSSFCKHIKPSVKPAIMKSHLGLFSAPESPSCLTSSFLQKCPKFSGGLFQEHQGCLARHSIVSEQLSCADNDECGWKEKFRRSDFPIAFRSSRVRSTK